MDASKFQPLHNMVMLKAVEVKLSNKVDLVLPDKHKKDQATERFEFFVEKWGPHVGANQEPYFSKTKLTKGMRVWLKFGSNPAILSPEDKEYCIVSDQDIIGVYDEKANG
jgi:co-chaperonin GroES (HSP10)